MKCAAFVLSVPCRRKTLAGAHMISAANVARVLRICAAAGAMKRTFGNVKVSVGYLVKYLHKREAA